MPTYRSPPGPQLSAGLGHCYLYSQGYIDDVAVLVVGVSSEANCDALTTWFEKAAKPRTATHGSLFSEPKF